MVLLTILISVNIALADDTCSFCPSPLVENKLYAATGDNGRIYVFDGSSWSVSHDSDETKIWALTTFNNNIYAGTALEGRVLKFDGSSWSTVFDSAQTYTETLCPFRRKVYAGIGPSAPIYSCTDGSSWSLSQSLSEAYILSMAVFNGKLYAGTGYNGMIFVFDGSSWTLAADLAESWIFSLEVYNGKLYATTGDDGRVYSSSDGSSWVLEADFPEQRLYSSEVYSGKLYVGGFPGGTVRVFDGSSWTLSTDTAEDNIAVLKTFQGKLYAGTSINGRIYVFDGSSWTLSTDTPEKKIYALTTGCASPPPTTTTSTTTTSTTTTSTTTTLPPTTTTSTSTTTTLPPTTTSTSTTTTSTTTTTIPCVPSCQGGGDVMCWDDPDALRTLCIGNRPVQTEFKCDYKDRKGTWECVDSDTRMRSGTDYYVNSTSCICVSQSHSQTENCLPGTQCEDGECVLACDGFINLEIDDDRVCPRDRIALRAHGMINCDRKLVSFRLESCDGQELTRCILRNGGCERRILSPKTIGPTEIYACIDKNMDSDFLDEGEQDFKSLNIDCNECPSNSRCRVAGCNFCAKCGGFCNSNVNQFEADRCLNPWETCDRTCTVGQCGATNCTAPSPYLMPGYHIGSFTPKICRR